MTMNYWKEIKYFTPIEFACKCEKHRNMPVYDMDEELVRKLDKLREMLGVPIRITSGWRCEEYNAKIGGEAKSYHVAKCAADFTLVRSVDPMKLPPQFAREMDSYLASLKYAWHLCEQIGFSGLGWYPQERFIHVDTGLRFSRWMRVDGKYTIIV